MAWQRRPVCEPQLSLNHEAPRRPRWQTSPSSNTCSKGTRSQMQAASHLQLQCVRKRAERLQGGNGGHRRRVDPVRELGMPNLPRTRTIPSMSVKHTRQHEATHPAKGNYVDIVGGLCTHFTGVLKDVSEDASVHRCTPQMHWA